MKILILFSLILVGAVFADDTNNCDTELERVHTEVLKCVNDDTFHFVDIHMNLKKLNDEEMTEDEFKIFIDDFCPKTLTASRCQHEKIPTISEECQTNEKVKSKKNMIQFYSTVFERLCKDDAKGYKDMIKNHGTKCFMQNNDLNECWKTYGLEYMDKANFNEENICKFVKAMVDCEEHLDKCDNPDVKPLSIEVHALVKEKFQCH